MKTLTLAIVAFAAIALVAVDAGTAAADGVSVRIGGSGYGCYGDSYYPYNTYYGRGYGTRYGWYGNYYPRLGRHTWHDTSHYDYHPGEFVRHYDHYHYEPGHWDFHEDGHWDHHHW
jgi:hypothetical protein